MTRELPCLPYDLWYRILVEDTDLYTCTSAALTCAAMYEAFPPSERTMLECAAASGYTSVLEKHCCTDGKFTSMPGVGIFEAAAASGQVAVLEWLCSVFRRSTDVTCSIRHSTLALASTFSIALAHGQIDTFHWLLAATSKSTFPWKLLDNPGKALIMSFADRSPPVDSALNTAIKRNLSTDLILRILQTYVLCLEEYPGVKMYHNHVEFTYHCRLLFHFERFDVIEKVRSDPIISSRRFLTFPSHLNRVWEQRLHQRWCRAMLRDIIKSDGLGILKWFQDYVSLCDECYNFIGEFKRLDIVQWIVLESSWWKEDKSGVYASLCRGIEAHDFQEAAEWLQAFK